MSRVEDLADRWADEVRAAQPEPEARTFPALVPAPASSTPEQRAERARAAREATAPVRHLPIVEPEPDEDFGPRPKTRGDCGGGERPCPFVSCRHHLYLDVHEKTGVVTFNAGAREVWEMVESCSLDVADRGGVILAEVAAAFDVTRERIRQIEARAIRRIGKRAPMLRTLLEREIRRSPAPAPRDDEDEEPTPDATIDDDE